MQYLRSQLILPGRRLSAKALNPPLSLSEADPASGTRLNETIPGILPDLAGRGAERGLVNF